MLTQNVIGPANDLSVSCVVFPGDKDTFLQLNMIDLILTPSNRVIKVLMM